MSRSRSTSAIELVAGLWLLAALLTLLTADELRDWLASDGRTRGTVIARLGERCDDAAHALRLDAVRGALHSVRGFLYGRSAGAAPTTPRTPQPSPGSRADSERPQVHRMLLIGASSMQFGLGPELEKALRRYGDLEVLRFAKSSTGLSRPEDFDWPAKLRVLLDRFHPDLVVANFGGNDAVDLPLPGRGYLEYGTAAWEAGYRGKIADLIAIAAAGGARTILIGMPIIRDLELRATAEQLNRLTQRAAEDSGAWYIDQRDLSATPDGQYREEVIIDGQRRLMRMPDGFHYTSWGGRYVVRGLLPRIERLVRLTTRDPSSP